MEKLIKLLNKYEEQQKKETGLRAYERESYGDGHLIQATNIVTKGKKTPLALIESRSLLKSKDYGFIQRLVRENKIDIGSQAMQYVKSDLSKFFTEWKDKNGMSDDCTMLLMLLAIQENPISFLISVLK